LDCVLLIDLDRTLYPPRAGLQEAGDRLLTAWMAQRLELSVPEVEALRRRLWSEYGTSARGLELEYGIPQAEVYANCIELLRPADYVWPRPEVREMLAGLPYPAFVCTNATELYSGRVLEALGLADCFRGVIAIQQMRWVAKPHPEAYRAALALVGVPAARTVFVDDSFSNVQGAQQVGLHAVLCHPQPRRPWPQHITDITALPGLLPGLLGSE